MSLYNFSINLKNYPLLEKLKKKDLDKVLNDIFKTGYQIHFPPTDIIKKNVEFQQILERIEDIKEEFNNDDLSEKISSLEVNLNKLINLSSNSYKKGHFAENFLEDIFNSRYGDITFERKSNTPHSGDAWIYLPNDKIIMIESKNYNSIVNKDEIIKLQNDMINHHIKWGIFISFNSGIQGMREMDYHTFTHQQETYSIIMISNLSTDIYKLDLGLQIIRKLMAQLDNLPDFPWIIKDINQHLIELNNIVQKNYILRDNYYNMERDIQKSLSNYYNILRDYQYDIEAKINQISNNIQSTIKDSLEIKPDIYQEIIDSYQDKKIAPILVKLIDAFKAKKWQIVIEDEIYKIMDNEMIGTFKVQNKKIVINLDKYNMILTLYISQEVDNLKTLNIIKTL